MPAVRTASADGPGHARPAAEHLRSLRALLIVAQRIRRMPRIRAHGGRLRVGSRATVEPGAVATLRNVNDDDVALPLGLIVAGEPSADFEASTLPVGIIARCRFGLVGARTPTTYTLRSPKRPATVSWTTKRRKRDIEASGRTPRSRRFVLTPPRWLRSQAPSEPRRVPRALVFRLGLPVKARPSTRFWQPSHRCATGCSTAIQLPRTTPPAQLSPSIHFCCASIGSNSPRIVPVSAGSAS